MPLLATLVSRAPSSELADVVERFTADQQSLNRRYDANESPAQRRRMREFYTGWRTRLGELNFDKLAQEGRVDYVLLDNYLQHQIALLDRQEKMRGEDGRRCFRSPTGCSRCRTRGASCRRSIRSRSRGRSPPSRSRWTACARLFEAPSGRGAAAVAAASRRPATRRGRAPRRRSVTKTVANRAAREPRPDHAT